MLVPVFALRLIWHLVDHDETTVINGVLTLGPDGRVGSIVVVVCWVWAVTAAIAVHSGYEWPLRRALKAAPVVLAALVGCLAVVIICALGLGLLLPSDPTVFAGITVCLAIPAAAIMVRLAVAIPVAVVEEKRGFDAFRVASDLVRGRAWRSGWALGLGIAVPALVSGWALGSIRPSGFVFGLFFSILTDVLLVALAAFQAVILAGVYRRCRLEGVEPTDDGQPQSSLIGDSEDVADVVKPRRIAIVLTLAALLLPTTLAGGVVASGRLPEVTTSPALPQGRLIQIGWPAGHHPILIGQSQILDCLDDTCGSVATTNIPVTVFEPTGGAAVAPDGSVFAMGQDSLVHCDVQRHCIGQDGVLEILRPSQAEAIALTPDGQLLIATATPVLGKEDQTELGLIQCRDVFCADPRRTRLGVVEGSTKRLGNVWRHRLLAVGTGRDGRPIVAFHPTTGLVWVGWCRSATCDSTDVGVHAANSKPDMPGNDELALLHLDGIFDCLKDVCRTGDAVATASRPQGGIYAVALEERGPEGIRLQIGQPAAPSLHAVLLSCDDHHCRQPKRIPVHVGELGSSNLPRPLPSEIWMMAANPDGRVLLVRPMYSPTVIITVKP